MADIIDFKTRRPVGAKKVEQLARKQSAADDFEYYGFDPSTLPQLDPFPQGAPLGDLETVDELRLTYLSMMSETNRAYFRSWTSVWFWGMISLVGAGSNYFLDKVRKADIRIDTKEAFIYAAFMPGPGLPKLQAENKGVASLRTLAEDAREEHLCRMTDEQVALFSRVDSMTFWLMIRNADEIDVDIAYANMTSGIERPLPAITGGTPGQIALAERLRDLRVPFFDDQTFERFGHQADCYFWIENMKKPICNFRKAAYNFPRRPGARPWILEQTDNAPSGGGASPATRKRWKRR